MRVVSATDAKQRLAAILDAAQREPVLIRRRNQDIAIVMSVADYDRLRGANVQAFLDLRNEVAAEIEHASSTTTV